MCEFSMEQMCTLWEKSAWSSLKQDSAATEREVVGGGYDSDGSVWGGLNA